MVKPETAPYRRLHLARRAVGGGDPCFVLLMPSFLFGRSVQRAIIYARMLTILRVLLHLKTEYVRAPENFLRKSLGRGGEEPRSVIHMPYFSSVRVD